MASYKYAYLNTSTGSWAPDTFSFDSANVPTTDEKAALAGEGTPSASDLYTCKSYVDARIEGLEWQDAVNHNINYIKAGVPTGVGATNGEKCLDTTNFDLYNFTGGSWDVGAALSEYERCVFKDDGDDAGGDAGTHTHNDKIYTYIDEALDDTDATEGMAFWLIDDDQRYQFNGTNWVVFAGTVTHNNLASLQGGTTAEYYHLTSDEHAGVHGATAITASNVVLTQTERQLLSVPLVFAYIGGIAISQTDTAVEDLSGTTDGLVMRKAGSIVGMSAVMGAGVAAGTLTIEPTLNGTDVTDASLDLTMTMGSPNDAYANAAPGVITFTAGQTVGVHLTTDGSFSPTNENIRVTVEVIYDQ